MTQDELLVYWIPARNKFGSIKGLRTFKASLALSKFLDAKEHFAYHHNFDRPPMGERLRQQLIALAGPHTETVIKIISLRKEDCAQKNNHQEAMLQNKEDTIREESNPRAG